MSETKRLTKITPNQISAKGVQALSNRPNTPTQYGVGGLSPTGLKLWFDNLATFIAEKINEIQDMLVGDEAAKYIRVLLDPYGVENLQDLVTAFTDGSFANKVLKLYSSAGSALKQSLQTIINKLAQDISTNDEDIAALNTNKLDKVTSVNTYRRAYMIDKDGTQKVIYICDTPVPFSIPMYSSGGQLNVAIPVQNGNAANKEYTDNRDKLLGSTVELSLNANTYVMTLKLKNTAGTVLSTTTIDLPLESMIIGGSYANGVLTLRLKNEDGHIDDNVINIDISDLIDGLVNVSTYNSGVATLNARIDKTNNNLQAFVDEVDLSKIYAHAAFHSEESETARNYTRGGGIDKKFREIDTGNGTSLSLTMDKDFKLTVSLNNKKGEVISFGMVDLPIESLITNASYANKILTLTFQSGNKLNINISDIVKGLVPETRKVNGKPLTADIVLIASDVGAYGKDETYSKTEVGNVVSNAVGTAKNELNAAIEGKEAVSFGYYAQEADTARGYIKGGEIDRELQKIKKRLNALETE